MRINIVACICAAIYFVGCGNKASPDVVDTLAAEKKEEVDPDATPNVVDNKGMKKKKKKDQNGNLSPGPQGPSIDPTNSKPGGSAPAAGAASAAAGSSSKTPGVNPSPPKQPNTITHPVNETNRPNPPAGTTTVPNPRPAEQRTSDHRPPGQLTTLPVSPGGGAPLVDTAARPVTSPSPLTAARPATSPIRPLPPPGPSPVVRSPHLHFVTDPATFPLRGIAGIENNVALCFIASPLQLLLHVPQLRTLIHTLANQTPPITGFSPLLEDFVYLFNKFWGDGWPSNPEPAPGTYPLVHIRDRVYASIVREHAHFELVHGQPAESDMFLPRLLYFLQDEIDRLLGGNQFLAMFEQRANGPGSNMVAGLITFSPGYQKLEEIIRLNFHIWGDDVYYIEPYPLVFTFGINPHAGNLADPPLVLTFINGVPVDRDHPDAAINDELEIAGRVQYDLMGYTVNTRGHYKAVVKHPDTGNWFQIDDHAVLEIPGHDPQRNGVMHSGYLITNIMYSKRELPQSV